jgi:hypothetical protein
MIKRASGKRVFAFFVYREVITSIGGLITWIAFIALFIFSGNWKVLFLVAAIGTLTSLFISEKAKEA